MRSKWALLCGVFMWTVPILFGVVGWINAHRAGNEIRARSAVDAALEELRDGANHGHLVIDAEGTVLGWNPALERWTGRTSEEMIGASLERVMPPEQWEVHQRAYLAFIGKKENLGRKVRLVCELLRTDGSAFPVEVNARSVHPPGQPLMSVALVDAERRIVDLTEHEAPQ